LHNPNSVKTDVFTCCNLQFRNIVGFGIGDGGRSAIQGNAKAFAEFFKIADGSSSVGVSFLYAADPGHDGAISDVKAPEAGISSLAYRQPSVSH
jgi:hypothetical protein